MRKHIKYTISLSVILLILMTAGCGQRSLSKERMLFDTVVTVTFFPQDTSKPKELLDKTLSRMAEVEKVSNIYDEKSELSLINSSDLRSFKLSKDAAEMVSLGIDWYGASAGTFDIGLGRVTRAWSIGSSNIIPASDELIRARSESRTSDMKLKGNSLEFLDSKPLLDASGLNKGYAADLAYRLLSKAGVKHGLINMGSTALAFGGKPDGQPWRIGIQHPRDSKALLGTIELKDGVVSTSGDYQQYFIKEGVRYHHIIDPQTSSPAKKSIAATVVTTQDATVSDILSTTVFIMGPVTGLELLERMPETEGLIIGADGKIVMTSGFKSIYKPEVSQIKNPAP